MSSAGSFPSGRLSMRSETRATLMTRTIKTALMIAAFSLGVSAQGGKLVWSDEFEGKAGSAPDPARWVHMKGGSGWGNKELQYYTDSTRNSRLDGSGSLVIEAKTADPGSKLECWYGDCRFTSARLTTKTLFTKKYGRFEARMKLPGGRGVWPAFWMLGDDIDTIGWPGCGEIDIMEMIGSEPSTLYGTLHGPVYSGATGIGKSVKLAAGRQFSDGFNVFAVEWEPGEIRWYLNGDLYQVKSPGDLPEGGKWVYDHPFFMILNLAVGGEWPGDPDEDTRFPARVEVDYVRVYEL